MSQKDCDELNSIMSDCAGMSESPPKMARGPKTFYEGDESKPQGDEKLKNLVQWSSGDGKRFFPASRTYGGLVPGVYEIISSQSAGIFFEKIPVNTGDLLRFPQTNSDKIIGEIQAFWEKEDLFKRYNLVYRRGIILWDPPGGGKTSTIHLINQDVVDRGGVVLKFGPPPLFVDGIRALREIQPDTPIVVLMEDIDSILECYNESEVLNILDGIDQVNKCLFLATTNYPERLGPRIINRPSRFDKRFKIGHPNAESRKMYLEHVIDGKGEAVKLKVNLDKWVDDTDGFSIAHLKELFVAVCILGDDYEDAIKALGTMKENISSDDDMERNMGFHTMAKRRR